MTTLSSLWPLLPEIIVAVGAMLLLMIGAFERESDWSAESIGWMAVAVLGSAIFFMTWQPDERVVLFDGAFVSDAYARFCKILVLAGSAAALMMSFGYLKRVAIMKFELPVLMLLAVVGMMMLVSAADLIALYLGLELMSLALYVLAAFRRDDVRSSEAGLKYFVLGALSSGMLLYGASLIYGFTGSTSFAVIAQVATGAAGTENIGLIVGLVFLLVGLAFKVSAVPFHMWTPDVYDGAPSPVTAFFAAAPKIAAMAVLVRVLWTAFPGIQPQWQQIIIFLSLASMLLGSFAAIGQTSIKRLLAYSSIANIGFALVGLSAATEDGVWSVLVYLGIYLVMTLGAFACVISMRRESGPVETIEDLAGLNDRHLGMATAFAALMFSLAGIPPLAGFFAKFYVLKAAMDAGLFWLAIIGVLASVVGAYYYLRVIKVMFFDEPKEPLLPVERGAGFVMALATAMVVLYVVFGASLEGPALAAAKSLRF